MKLRIEIKMDNAAFDDNPDEVSDILFPVGRRVFNGDDEFNLHDHNGNTVGKVVVTGRPKVQQTTRSPSADYSRHTHNFNARELRDNG